MASGLLALRVLSLGVARRWLGGEGRAVCDFATLLTIYEIGFQPHFVNYLDKSMILHTCR